MAFPVPFVSYAQNAEDVVLHRCLGHISNGRYIEVGSNDPVFESVTWAFYDAGWSGVAIEPNAEYAPRFRAKRPRDHFLQVAIASEVGERTLHQMNGTGLSTLSADLAARQADRRGFEIQPVTVSTRTLDSVLSETGWAPTDDIHFLVVDVEGFEREVLLSIDFSVWRPWILVVEALAPDSAEPNHQQWEPLLVDSGYQFALFDGLSRFYIADERAADLAPTLRAPANVLDHALPAYTNELHQKIERLTDERDSAVVALTYTKDQLAIVTEQLHDSIEIRKMLAGQLEESIEVRQRLYDQLQTKS